MPSVPYTGVPTVAPSEQGTPNISVDTPIAAFGGTVASAIGSVGQAAQHAGSEIMNRAIALQELQNDTMAKEQDAKYMMRVGEIHARYNSLEGQDAVAAYPKYIRDLQALRRDYRDALPNPDARRRFDSSSLSFMSRNIFNGAGHAATQQRTWSRGASNARVEAVNNDVARDPSQGAFDNGVRTIEQEVRDQEHGWSPEQIENEVTKRKSKLIATRIQSLARTQPFEAARMLEENRGQMAAADIPTTERVVQTNRNNAGARSISNEVNPPIVEGVEGPPLQERIDEGMRRAREVAPDDPGFADYVRDRIITDYNRMRSVSRDDNLRTRNVVDTAMGGQGNNGRAPTSVEELTADPEVAAAWQRLTARQQQAYQKVLAKNARGDFDWNEDRRSRYYELLGMSDGERRNEFLDVDITAEEMPWTARNQLINRQRALRRVSDNDPRIGAAMTQLNTILQPAGITPRQDPTRYNQFKGALIDAIQTFQQEKNKSPNAQEVQEIGTRLLQQQVQPGRIFGSFWPNRPSFFEMSVPDDLLKAFKADPRFNGREPTEFELERFRRQYVNRRYQELFGGRSEPNR